MAEIAAAQRRFLRLFAMNDIAGIGACYTEDARMLVANMEVISGRTSMEVYGPRRSKWAGTRVSKATAPFSIVANT